MFSFFYLPSRLSRVRVPSPAPRGQLAVGGSENDMFDYLLYPKKQGVQAPLDNLLSKNELLKFVKLYLETCQVEGKSPTRHWRGMPRTSHPSLSSPRPITSLRKRPGCRPTICACSCSRTRRGEWHQQQSTSTTGYSKPSSTGLRTRI